MRRLAAPCCLRAGTIVGAFMAVLAAAPAPALATSKTQTSSAGAVTATFSFTVTSKGTYPAKLLTISRAGQIVYHQPVGWRYCGSNAAAQKYCAPGGQGSALGSVHVVDLNHTGEPNVVLDLYTGGAHCCSVEEVFSFDPGTGTYVHTDRNFGDPGERIVDLNHDGRHQFLTADDAFAYAFTDYADSGLPIEILTFTAGHFADVTRSYPKLIAKDAAQYLTAFRHHLGDGDGLIAAWAADEYRLGRRALVSSVLATELRAGHLRSQGWPSGRKFVAALNKFLRQHGYVH
jgi:hypothetical protein